MEMDQLVALCKRRGFLFQSSEIYGGLNGFWDYGPLGVELKRNVREAWWHDMVTGHDELAVAAGRPVDLRNDRPRLHDHHAPAGLEVLGPLRPVPRLHGRLPRVEDAATATTRSAAAGSSAKGQRVFVATRSRRRRGPGRDRSSKALKFFNLRAKNADELAWDGPLVSLTTVDDFSQVLGPDAKTLGTLTEPREFNLMFKTYVGALGDEKSRPFSAPKRPRASSSTSRTCSTAPACGSRSASPRSARASATRSRRGTSPSARASSSRWRSSSSAIPSTSPRVVQVLARPPLPVVPRPRPGRRPAAAARPRHGRAEPLLVRHGRHRVRLPVPAAGRVRRAGGHRPSRRLRPAQPHGRQARAPGRRSWSSRRTPTASRGTAAAART